MKNGIILSVGAAALLASAGAAQAATASIDGLGGEVQIVSGVIDGVFGTSSPDMSPSALANIHGTLMDDGIETNGKVTSVFLETDNGLAWVILVDKQLFGDDDRGGPAASLLFASTADGDKDPFINDDEEMEIAVFGGGLQAANGQFNWNSDGEGDGFAWAGLEPGDFMTFQFEEIKSITTQRGGTAPTSPGLDSTDTFQFASWTGDSFELMPDMGSFSIDNQFAYSVTILPLPQPAMLGLAGLAGLGVIRRRKA